MAQLDDFSVRGSVIGFLRGGIPEAIDYGFGNPAQEVAQSTGNSANRNNFVERVPPQDAQTRTEIPPRSSTVAGVGVPAGLLLVAALGLGVFMMAKN